MKTTRRTAARVAVAVVAGALVLASPVVSTAPSAASPVAAADGAAARPGTNAIRLALPRPTGPYAVGRDVLHLTDHSRADPWVPEAKARELMVSMYYPALTGAGQSAPYLTTTEARLLLRELGQADAVPAEALGATRATARADARPRPGRYPLVVLSPGFSLHRHTLTHLAEELASHGYVVAAVDHAYESVGTVFPGRRVLPCTACAAVAAEGFNGYTRVATGRVRDITFLLGRLTGPRQTWRHAGLIDRTRIGMAGHSVGGNAAAATMAADPRVRAGINMDGTFFTPVPADGLDGRPFLLMGTQSVHSPDGLDATWDRDWQELDGWKGWLTVTGTAHIDFTDMPVISDQAGLVNPDSPLSGERTAEIVRAYVRAFFDLHLRGVRQPLLDGPTSGNPEVAFHRP